MIIVQTDARWRLIGPQLAGEVCLHSLARRNGYRLGLMCRELGCSERYFRIVCHHDLKMPPMTWLRAERTAVACQLLAEGQEAVEVAAELGFSSLRHLLREMRGTQQRSGKRIQS